MKEHAEENGMNDGDSPLENEGKLTETRIIRRSELIILPASFN